METFSSAEREKRVFPEWMVIRASFEADKILGTDEEDQDEANFIDAVSRDRLVEACQLLMVAGEPEIGRTIMVSVIEPVSMLREVFVLFDSLFKVYTHGGWIETQTGVYHLKETPPYVLVLLLDFIHGGNMLNTLPRGPGEGLEYVYTPAQVHGQGCFVVPDGDDLISRDTILVIDRLVQMFKLADFLEGLDLRNQLMDMIVDEYKKVYFPKNGCVKKHHCNVPIYNARFIFENIPFSTDAPLHKLVIDCLFHTLKHGVNGTLNKASVGWLLPL
jgi:hypothetical protein